MWPIILPRRNDRGQHVGEPKTDSKNHQSTATRQCHIDDRVNRLPRQSALRPPPPRIENRPCVLFGPAPRVELLRRLPLFGVAAVALLAAVPVIVPMIFQSLTSSRPSPRRLTQIIFRLDCLAKVTCSVNGFPIRRRGLPVIRTASTSPCNIAAAPAAAVTLLAFSVSATSSASSFLGSCGSIDAYVRFAKIHAHAPRKKNAAPKAVNSPRGGNDFLVGTTGASRTLTLGISFASCTLASSYCWVRSSKTVSLYLCSPVQIGICHAK